MKQQSAALLDSDQKGFWGNQYWTYLSGLRRRGFHLGFLSFALAAVLLSQNWGSPRTIIIEVDGQVYSFTTPQRRVSAILREAGINLRPEDQPTPNRNELVLEGEKISLTQAIPVVVDVDGKVERFYTAADTIGQVLAEAKIGLSRYDKVMDGAREVSSQEPLRSLATIANGGPPPGNGLGKGSSVEVKQVATSGDIGYLQPRYPPREIAVLRAVPITITDNGLAIMVMTTEPTLAQALGAQGITIYPGDLVSPDLQAPTNAWTHVFIKRTKGLTVEVDQRLKRHRTFAKTIAEALTEAGIEIGPLDRVEPGLPSRLDDEASIRIVRVKEEFITEEAIIPRTTIYQPDSELELDQQRVNEGSDGLRRWITKIVYEDGTEVSRSTERAWIERGPVNKVVRYGTNIVIRTIDTPEGTLEYWRRMNVLATWYDASHGGKPRDHPQYGRTRLGYIAQKGIVAVDPNVISMLTRMYITGYGIGLAADTGGAIKGRHIDVAYSEGEPHNWGLRRLDIYLLTPISPEDTIRWILP